jgi:transcriptional regulator with XRE-family HTH domain
MPHTAVRMKVNTRLRVLRAERGLSQMDTAAKAGIALNRYWRIENGYVEPTDDERDALASKAFDVPVAEAFPESVAS